MINNIDNKKLVALAVGAAILLIPVACTNNPDEHDPNNGKKPGEELIIPTPKCPNCGNDQHAGDCQVVTPDPKCPDCGNDQHAGDCQVVTPDPKCPNCGNDQHTGDCGNSTEFQFAPPIADIEFPSVNIEWTQAEATDALRTSVNKLGAQAADMQDRFADLAAHYRVNGGTPAQITFAETIEAAQMNLKNDSSTVNNAGHMLVLFDIANGVIDREVRAALVNVPNGVALFDALNTAFINAIALTRGHMSNDQKRSSEANLGNVGIQIQQLSGKDIFEGASNYGDVAAIVKQALQDLLSKVPYGADLIQQREDSFQFHNNSEDLAVLGYNRNIPAQQTRAQVQEANGLRL